MNIPLDLKEGTEGMTGFQSRAVALAFAAPAALLLFPPASTEAQQSPASRTGSDASAPLAPLVDHHHHLISPMIVEMMKAPRTLKPVQLPREFSSLLEARAAAAGDPAALGKVYSRDSLILRDAGPVAGLVRGLPTVATYMSGRFPQPYKFIPARFDSDGDLASIVGYLATGPKIEDRVASFHATLRREQRSWRIAAETIAPFSKAPLPEPVDAAELVAMLDEAGIGRAVVLSGAFGFGGRGFDVYREVEPAAAREARMRAENEWTAEQVALYPSRLIAFCSVNPLDSFALRELRRCGSSGRFKGLKLHLDEAEANFQNPDHVAKIREVFAEANQLRLPIVVHPGNNRTNAEANVRIFLDRIVSAAPDVTVQVAHLWGGGAFSAAALSAYVKAVSERHPSTRNLIFDMAEAPLAAEYAGPNRQSVLTATAEAIRTIGVEKVFFASDVSFHLPPNRAWEQFRGTVPLTDEEFRAIARNVAPYLR